MSMNKYTLIVSILLISLFVFLSFAGKANATQYCPTTITVIDENTGIHISGATVTWGDGTLTTNVNGQVTFNTIIYSNNEITASASEYETKSTWVFCASCDNPINEIIYLKRIVQPPQHCTLDIYVKDQNNVGIEGSIYVDGSYKYYDDHTTIDVQVGTHNVEARKSGYEPDTETVTCSCSETKRVDLTLKKIEEKTDIRIGSLRVDPDYVCIDEYETVRISAPITLEHGNDDTFIVAKFYVEDNNGGWHYIDKDEKRLDIDETETFSIDFHYHDYFLDEGTHDVRVKVENDDILETAFSELHVTDCVSGRYMIDVGSINVDNEYPDKGDIVQVSTPITLDYDRLPKTVYVYGYIDGNLVNSVNMKFDESDTMTYQFTIDTEKYSAGSHTIKVKAEVKGKIDTSTRTFSISPVGYYIKGERCLFIDKMWTDDDLKAGESNKVNVKVLSCGTKYERNVKMKLEAFSKTYYTGEFDIPSGDSRDVFVTIAVPEDVSEKQTFKATVWNSYTSNTLTKDFVVSTGMPFIEIRPEFVVENCQKKRIRFDVINNGKVSDTFTISLTGSGAEWITGAPETITLNPNEKKTVYAYVSIPCWAEPGFYGFTITTKGSPEYSVSSTIHVIKTLKWPTINTTGLFVGFGAFCWLPWVLIILLILFLLLFFAGYNSLITSRKRPMFDCCGHGC
jgi:hypothetical protein